MAAKLDAINKHEVIEILQELVRIPTPNPPGRERECAKYIRERIEDWGIKTTFVTKPFESRPQIVASYGTGQEPILVLNTHMDVVPEGDPKDWRYDPYGAIIDNGRLYGRGSCDTKAGIAAAMLATKALAASNITLKGTLLLQFIIGEEMGEPGTKTLLEEGYVGDWAIVLEPTDLRTATSAKGLAWYEITIKGKASHASAPEKGNNAVLKAMEVLKKLEEYARQISKVKNPLVGHATSAITMIHGGTKENIIPELCKITIDRRFLPDETAKQVEVEIGELLNEVFKDEREFNYEYKPKRVLESAEIPVNSRIAQVVRRHSKEIAAVADEPFGMIATTDQRNFVNDANMPAVIWGPGSLEQAHTVDEYVEIRQVLMAVEILVATAKELLFR